MCRLPRACSLFPYTTLFRSTKGLIKLHDDCAPVEFGKRESILCRVQLQLSVENFKVTGLASDVTLKGNLDGLLVGLHGAGLLRDRKSTRLNSSHTVISYAVF